MHLCLMHWYIDNKTVKQTFKTKDLVSLLFNIYIYNSVTQQRENYKEGGERANVKHKLVARANWSLW